MDAEGEKPSGGEAVGKAEAVRDPSRDRPYSTRLNPI
jgi:hypothetical protein